MLKDLIIKNEEQIENFEIGYFKENKNYPVVAALSALETTNEIQKSYFELEDANSNFNVLKLYAFLQSLFVSVDSLYALAFSLTKSKSFINLNKNQVLRELKFIRNDVVGHPANRMYNATTLAYCILDASSVTKDKFSYDIYSGQGIERKCIYIPSLVQSFYEESNALLSELYRVAENEEKNTKLTNLALEVLNLFDMSGKYLDALDRLKKEYLNTYPNANSNQHRLLWRMELIDRIKNYHTSNLEIASLAEYCIGLEIVKIYQLFSGKKYELQLGTRKPSLVSSMYRFLKSNKNAVIYIDDINDLKNPLLKTSMLELIKLAKTKNAKGVIQYLELLEGFYQNQEDALLYAFALPLKEFKKGK